MNDPTYDVSIVHHMCSDVLWLTRCVAVSALLHVASPGSFLAFIPLGIAIPAAVLLTIHAQKGL